MTPGDGGALYGTLELLILKTLKDGGPLHGVGIADRIVSLSRDAFRIEEGSLYPALHRLQGKGLVEWEWMTSEKGKRAKYYTISPAGEKALQADLTGWISNTRALMNVLDLGWEEMR